MNIAAFTVGGPTIDARLPLPRPSEQLTEAYPWNDFLGDLGAALAEYADGGSNDVHTGDMTRHVGPDGTCYWIRAELDNDQGIRFLRVFMTDHDAETCEMSLKVEQCSQDDVPGRLRLN